MKIIGIIRLLGFNVNKMLLMYYDFLINVRLSNNGLIYVF